MLQLIAVVTDVVWQAVKIAGAFTVAVGYFKVNGVVAVVTVVVVVGQDAKLAVTFTVSVGHVISFIVAVRQSASVAAITADVEQDAIDVVAVIVVDWLSVVETNVIVVVIKPALVVVGEATLVFVAVSG